MQVGTLAVQHLFERDVLYLVPLYQRPYVWTQGDQWEPLWEDVRRIAERLMAGEQPRAHFLGASVQDRPAVPPGQIESRVLIDGQQRLTTLQLLLKAFQDLMNESDDDRYYHAVVKLTQNDHPLSTKPFEKFKVWPTNADRHDYQATMEAGSRAELLRSYDKRTDAKTVGRNIPDGYLFFYDAIADWLDEEGTGPKEKKIPALYSTVRDNVRLVVIDLDEKDDAQLIFETLNARGTPLLAADLVKNSLLSEIQAADGDAEAAYERYWQQFDLESGFWRSEIGRGHARRARIEVFLQHALTLLNHDEVTAGHLYTAYKDFASNPTSPTPLDRLKDFKRYGQIYKQLQEGHDNQRIALFLERLQAMDVGTAWPFLLKLFDKLGGDDDRLAAVLIDVESFLVRRMVCRLSTRGYNRLFVDLAGTIDVDDDQVRDAVRGALLAGTAEFDRWPTDDEFLRAWADTPLYENITRPRLRLILEGLEAGIRNHFAESHEVPRSLTVEHVMPQAWEAHWPLPNDDDDEAVQTIERNRLIHTIGNLTLLNEKLNPVQSNNPWVVGGDAETGKREGLRQNSVLYLNKQLCEFESWDEDNIEGRSRALFDTATGLWPHP